MDYAYEHFRNALENAVEKLDGREPFKKNPTRFNSVQKAWGLAEPMTEREFAAYLAGEYEMLFRLLRADIITITQAASTLRMSIPKTVGLQRTWALSKMTAQREEARLMIFQEAHRQLTARNAEVANKQL